MAATMVHWILLVLSFATMVPGVALLWRTFHSDSNLTGKVYRLAQYEACGFVFFWVLSALAVHFLNAGKSATVVRALSVGVMVYVTIYAVFTNFNTLNNLRIVDESNNKVFYYPQATDSGFVPIERVLQRKYLGGLILGYFSLFFGLLATNSALSFGNIKGGAAIGLYILGLLLTIPGVIVCWSNSSVAPYPYFTDSNGNANPNIATDLAAQYNLFEITTFVMIQWFVLTTGLIGAAEDSVLLNASGFIFGIGNLFAPVAFFYIESTNPGDADFLWAGPILCWIGCAVFAAVAAVANTAQKEASV